MLAQSRRNALAAFNVSRRHANSWASEEEQQYGGYEEAAPAPQAAPDPLEQLKQLGELKAQGVLTEAEFEAQKAKILAGA